MPIKKTLQKVQLIENFIYLCVVNMTITNKLKIMHKCSLGTFLVTRLEVKEEKRDKLHFICNNYYKHDKRNGKPVLDSSFAYIVGEHLEMKASEFVRVMELVDEWEGL